MPHLQGDEGPTASIIFVCLLQLLKPPRCCCCCCSLHDRRPGEGGGGGARAVAETVQHFITAMDSLKLNLVAVDQVRGGDWVGWGW